MSTGSMTKKNWLILLAIGFFGYGAFYIQDIWLNSYIYDVISPDPSIVALKTGLSAIVATLVTFIAGTFSDRVGRRKPFIALGFTIWGLMAILLPRVTTLSGSSATVMVIAMTLLMAVGTSTGYDSTFQAWVSDITNKGNRGKVMGVLGMMPLAVILALAVAGVVIDKFGYTIFFTGAGIVFGGIGLFTALTIKEEKMDHGTGENIFKQMISVFSKESLKVNKQVFLLFLFASIMTISSRIFITYEIIYMEKFLGIPKTLGGLLGMFMVPVTIVLSIVIGKLNDNGHAYKVLAVAPILYSVGCLLFSTGQNFWILAIFKIINSGALVAATLTTVVQTKNLIPENRRGQFEGVRMIFLILAPMLIGPSVGSWIISSFGEAVTVNGVAGYIPTPMLFQTAAVLALVAYGILALLIKNKKAMDANVTEEKVA